MSGKLSLRHEETQLQNMYRTVIKFLQLWCTV